MTIRVLVADDQALVRAGLRAIIDNEPDLQVVGEAADGAEALAHARRTSPDVVLMDVRMPGVDGITATENIVAADLPCRVVVLTTFDLDAYVYRALKAGASGFILKDMPRDQLVAAIRTAAGGEAVLAPALTRRLIDTYVSRGDPGAQPEPDPRLARLSPRELDVFRLVAAGRTNAEIAAELYVGTTTVKSHVASILHKIGLRDRIQAIVYAHESGVVGGG